MTAPSTGRSWPVISKRSTSTSREARNGREALDALRAARSDVAVVLLDIVMPEMDGYETLAAIKADEAFRHLPVIMISGVEELESVVRCIELGATDYLPKPFNPSDPRGARPRVARRKRLHDLEVESRRPAGRAAADDRPPEGGAQPLPLATGRGARLHVPRASSSSPAIGARRRPCSATCAASRLQRGRRARGGARRSARVPRHDGRADRAPRRHAGAFRR